MQAIEGARIIPGAHVDESPAEGPRIAAERKVIRGKALIFWDPKVPGKKLDAIDTDQITPADDCGAAMGDIFRRNALNLGLTVIQSRQAVEDAQEGDTFSFDPETRTLENETRGKSYEPAELSPQEEEIRRSGGIIKIGRREFPDSVRRAPDVKWPDAAAARRLTSTEQILWAHRVDKDAEVRPGATLRVYADLLPASDGTAPFSIHTFNEITSGDTIRPRQIAIANDHFVFNHRD